MLRAATWSAGVMTAYAVFCVAVAGPALHVDRVFFGLPANGTGLRIGDLLTCLMGTTVLYRRSVERDERKLRKRQQRERIDRAIRCWRAGIPFELHEGDPDTLVIRAALKREFGET